MKTSAPALVPFLRSDAQARLLAELLLGRREELSLTELATAMGVAPSTAYREVERLVEADLVLWRRAGRTRLVRINRAHRHVEPLTQILASAYGPVLAISDHLGVVPGVEQAIVFGSYAARYQGHPGPPPADADVLVIGEASGRDLRRAASRVEEVVHMPVQVTAVTPAEWAGATSGLVRDVRAKPTIPVPLETHHDADAPPGPGRGRGRREGP